MGAAEEMLQNFAECKTTAEIKDIAKARQVLNDVKAMVKKEGGE